MKKGSTPAESTVPVRDCRGFDTQPFARCYVEFEYEEGPCPIYEEFAFNDAGEMTFIEAWSNLPDLLPNAADDPWAEDPDFPRLATRVPGLGNETGTLDLESEWMQAAAAADPDVADFFAAKNGKDGHAGRSWAWAGVAEMVRRRSRSRMLGKG